MARKARTRYKTAVEQACLKIQREKGWTLEDIADYIGCERKTLRDWRKDGQVTLYNQAKLLEELSGTPADTLAGYDYFKYEREKYKPGGEGGGGIGSGKKRKRRRNGNPAGTGEASARQL